MTFFRKVFPHPLLTILLTLVWCLLVNRPSHGAVAFGLILGIIIPIMTSAYWPERPAITRPWRLFSYFGLVCWDIMVANVEVAMIVLFKPNDKMQPNWVKIPLDLRTPEAITVLASTITLTPGTLSADLSDDGQTLLVHALDAPDPDAVRDEIKKRYEARLMEIFPC
ncbi:MAG: Na+/H+ antiporter subunit E [Pseudomonadota bacterium]